MTTLAQHVVKTYGFSEIAKEGDVTVLSTNVGGPGVLPTKVLIIVTQAADSDVEAMAFRSDLPDDFTAGSVIKIVQTSDDVYHLANAAARMPVSRIAAR